MLQLTHPTSIGHRLATLGFCGLLLCLLGLAPLQAAPLDDALRAMAAGDGARAAGLLLGVARGQQGDAALETRLLAARAYLQANRIGEAAALYREVSRAATSQPLKHKAIFGQAECEARTNRFEQAERLFAEGLAGLTTTARRDELIRLLLRLGDLQLKPPTSQQAPDPERAVRYYEEALELKPEGELAEQVAIQLARAHGKRKQATQGGEVLRGLLKTMKADAPRRPEILYRAARSFWKGGNPVRARELARELLAQHLSSPYAPKAAFLLARTYGLPQPSNSEAWVRGSEALRRFLAAYPEDPRAEQARLWQAQAPLHLKRYPEAEEGLRAFIRQGGKLEQLAEARYQLGATLAGQGRWAEAAQAYRDYLQAHQAHAHWAAATRGIEEMAWQEAQTAFTRKQWRDAAERFHKFAETYPAAGNDRAAQAWLSAARAHLEAARPAPAPTGGSSAAPLEPGQLDLAFSRLTTLTAKYPNTTAAHSGWFMLGQLQEEQRQDYAKAREAYGRVKQGPDQAEAASRLQSLDQEALAVEAPPTFRSGRRPKLVWYTRNLERVNIAAYRLQAEEAFRDQPDLDRVAEVDIALCTPDRTWNVPVQGYEKHRRIRQEVPLPFDRPGLYLLHLTAGKLEATTAVRVSDLEVIFKAGAGQLFVFAEDLHRQAPWGGTRILVARGRKLLFDGETGGDGIFRRSLTEPTGEASLEDQDEEQSAGLRVFAVRGDHIAWLNLDENPSTAVETGEGRAFLFAERPVYRPGDAVQLAGIVRDAPRRQPGLLRGVSYTLTVENPRHVVLGSFPVTLDEFGVFHQELILDRADPPGPYSFTLKGSGAGISNVFTGSFKVEEFRRLPFTLAASFDRAVVFAGEPLAGVIRVRHPSGTPAPEQQVQWRAAGDPEWQTGRTDGQGELRFTLPTRSYEESRQVKLELYLPDSAIVGEATALVTVQEFNLELEVADRTLFAGQPFDLKVRTRGTDGKPVGSQPILEVLHQRPPTRGEVRISRQELQLPAAQGEVRVPITLPEAGSYLLRVLAFDRQHHPVTAERAVTVIGGEEPGFRLDVERTRLTVGSQARVTLHSRLAAGLVLLTWEADGILGHRLVPLREGQQSLELPITEELVPNVALVGNLMHEDRFWEASRELEIARKLKLELKPGQASYGPGDEVTLELRATDEEGRPVAAEILLAVVDAALLAAFPEKLADLAATFHTARELGQLLTVASNTQQFAAVTGTEITRAEVKEAEGSAAMAAIRERREAVTAAAAESFVGGLGLSGTGAGGGGRADYGRGVGSLGARSSRVPKVIPGSVSVQGGKRQQLRQYFAETAAFFHDLRTDREGRARATFRLPDTITSWTATARAVTRDTQVGDTKLTFAASLPFWAELAVPPELEAGDRVQPWARLFNETPQPLQVRATLQLEGLAAQPGTQQVTVPPAGTAEVTWPQLELPATAGQPGEQVVFRLDATGQAVAGAPAAATPAAPSPPVTDQLRLARVIRPHGLPEVVTATGVIEHAAAGPVTRTLELAEGLTRPALRVDLSLRVERLLLGPGADTLLFGDRPEYALLALHHLALLGTNPPPAELSLVRTQLRRTLLHLVAVQHESGGWSWCGDCGEPDLELTAAAVRALALARPLAGRLDWTYPQPQADRAVAFLEKGLAGLPAEETVRRTLVLHALAQVSESRVPFVQINRLHRLRAELPVGTQALLGLTWLRLGRRDQAAEVVATLRPRLRFGHLLEPQAAVLPPGPGQPEPWPTELELLRALALLAATQPAADPLVQAGRSWLFTRSARGWWLPDLAAAAADALERLLAAGRMGERGRIRVRVNDQEAGTLELRGGGNRSGEEGQLIVAEGLLRPGKNKIELVGEGGGRLFYSLALYGYRSALPAPADRDAATLTRHVELVPELYRGREIKGGFTVTGGAGHFRNEVSRAPAGERLQVTLKLDADRDRPYGPTVIEDLLPPGCELVEGSLRGGGHLLREGRRLALFLPEVDGVPFTVQYQLAAIHPGSYRFAAAQLTPLLGDHPPVLGGGTPFTVDPRGTARPEVRPTPDELYHVGLAAAELNDAPRALASLEQLIQDHPVREQITNQLLPRLLLAAIDVGDHPKIVKYFELAKEKDPALVIPFEKIEPIQAAYRTLKAHEGGLHLSRGIADARFMADVRLVGFLEEQGALGEASPLLRRLLLDYPDSGLTASALYSYGQVVYNRADRLARGEEELVKPFDRPWLLDEAINLMARFVGSHPGDPQAPPALFSLAAAQLERGRARDAVAWGEAGLRRHGQDEEQGPALAYLTAYGRFRLGDYGESLELCRQVVRRAAPAGEEDANRDMALYIMAQIQQARGNLTEAQQLYRQVEERFTDAAETLRELQYQEFSVPDVVTVPAGQFPELKARVRNIREVELRAYSVDLLKLYLLKGSLDNLGEVNLAGIKPVLSQQIRLADPQGRGSHEERLLLRGLPGRGAYLVLSRGGGRLRHTLVLIDHLTCELSRAEEGRSRLTVRDSGGRPLSGARVQLKGQEDETFTAGETDLRGIFLAEELNGSVTAIAHSQGRYCLYRQGSGAADVVLESTGEARRPATPAPNQAPIQQKKQRVYDFEDDVVEGQLVRPDKNVDDARNFFEKARQVQGMTVEQAK